MTAKLTREFLRLLREDPEFREEVRRQVLTDELLALPRQMAVLTQQVTALAQRVDGLAQQVAALAEAQRRTEERVDGLAQRVDGLAQQVTALAQQVAALAEAQRRTEGRLDRVETRLGRLETDVGFLKGQGLEAEWREKAPSYLGPYFRGVRVWSRTELWDLLHEAEDRGILGPDKASDVGQADVVAEGREKRGKGRVRWVVVEVSWTVGREDVERARRRADLLARLGVPTVAVAAGCEASEDVLGEARGVGVWVLLDGRRVVGGGS